MTQNHQILLDIAQKAQNLLNAETMVVALAEAEGTTVYYAAAVGKYAEWIMNKRGDAATSGLCGVAFQETCPVLVRKTEGDLRVRQDHAQTLGIKTALAVPLYYQEKLLGALMALNRNDGSLFDEQTEYILANYAPEAAFFVYQFSNS